MDDARALLNSLMGDTRNASKEERKKKRVDGFTDRTVCKYHLLGFCPEYEELFNNTKRDLGKCPKTHFQVSKDEFENHPQREKYYEEYEEMLYRHLKDHVRKGDEWAVKERQKNEETAKKALGAGGNAAAQEEIQKLRDVSAKLMAEAEDMASAGKVHESKERLTLANEYAEKADNYTQKALDIPEVCDICGLTKENNSGKTGGGDKANKFQHEMGKVHQGFVMIRSKYEELRKKWGDPAARAERERERAARENADSGKARRDDGRRRRDDDEDSRRKRDRSGDRETNDGRKLRRRDDDDRGDRGRRRY